MRAIRYNHSKKGNIPVTAKLIQSQSAMRAIRYNPVEVISEVFIELGRNPLCVQ